MTSTSFVFELVPLRGENEFEPHPQNAILDYLLGVLFKISDDHPCHFYMGVLPPAPPLLEIFQTQIKLLNFEKVQVVTLTRFLFCI